MSKFCSQDWYLYHIVCLRVLDFFKTRRDFLPNLVRHISTSAIADTFKYFIRLDDLFNKIVMEVRISEYLSPITVSPRRVIVSGCIYDDLQDYDKFFFKFQFVIIGET